MKLTIPAMLFFTAMTASCAGQHYAGRAGLRKQFPEVTCGETSKTRKGVHTKIYQNVDLGLFEEFGYCVPERLFNYVAIRAAVLQGTYSAEDGSFNAPGTAINPQVWARALEYADTDANGTITDAEANTLVERTLKEIQGGK